MNPPCHSRRRAFLSPQHAVLLIATSLLSLLTACGGASAPPSGSSLSPSGLLVSPAYVNFGTTPQNSQPVTRTLRLANMGFSHLTIDSVALNPKGVFRAFGWSGPLTLAPLQSAQLIVVFQPGAAAVYQGKLELALHSGGRSRKDAGSGLPSLNELWTSKIALIGSASSATKSMSVAVAPNSANLTAGQSLQFSVSVTGSGQKSVTWSAALGSISSYGLYTAPQTNQKLQDIVTATSVRDPNAYASAIINVSPAGTVPPHGQVSVAISPGSASIRSGQIKQFTATVSGTSNSAVTWSAKLGTVNSSGLYSAPQVSSQVVDTVTAVSLADSTKYSSVSVTVQGGTTSSGGPYSITNQEPVTDVPYPNSFVSQQLPSDVMNHLYGGCSSGSGCSDTIAQTAITGGGSTGAGNWGNSCVSTPGINDYDFPVYYATSSDPTYCITSCTYHVSGPDNPVGKCFHAPSGAQFAGNPNGGTANGPVDQNIIVWDQSQDVLFSAYTNGSNNPSLPACSSGSTCNVSFSYCSLADRQTDQAWNNSPVVTNGLAAEAGLVRGQELIQQQINHAIYLNAYCTADNVVFPNVSPASTARTCSSIGLSGTNRPPNGALFFLDYTPSQLAYLQTVLPAWQYPLISAMSQYGAYLGDTGGSYDTLHIAHFETGQAYKFAGVADPLWDFLDTNCGGACTKMTKTNSPPNSSAVYALNFLSNMPNLPGPNCASSSCGVLQHMHIADPCIAKGLAGMTAAQGACF